MARQPRRQEHVPFNGESSESLADAILASATQAAQKEVADNHARGLDSPGGRDGKVVLRTPRGRLLTRDR